MTRQQQTGNLWRDYNLGTLVSYAALLTGLEAKREVYGLAEVWESNTTPVRWLTQKVIEGLIEQNLASAEPHLLAPNCNVILNHRNDDRHLKSVLDELGRRQIDYMDKSLLSLTRAYLKADLHAHIRKQLGKVGIDLTLTEDDFETLATALERHNLSQLYMIIWQTAQNLSCSNLRFFSLSEGSGSIAVQIESACLETLNKYESKNRVIKPFQYSQNNRPSLSLVLFNSVLGINDRYHTNSLRQIWNHYA